MTNLTLTQPYTAEALKMIVFDFRPLPADAFCLAVYLGTYWDGSSANPVINPDPARICHALGVTLDELLRMADALTRTVSLAELEAGERPDWAINYASDDPTSIVSFKPSILQWSWADRARLKDKRMSINHIKAGSRYQLELKAGLAKAIILLALAMTRSTYNDFGFSKYEYGTARHRIWHHDRYGKIRAAKMQHNAQFTNKLLRDRTPEGAAKLIEVRVLSDEDIEESFSATVALGEINEKFLLGGNYESILEAVEEINVAGWHTVRVVERGDDISQWLLVITPTLRMHQLVWDLDYNAPGSLMTQWELKNGFLPNSSATSEGGDPMTTLPPLGYHYLYGLRSARKKEFVSVGQTSQSLGSRLHQHSRSGSNRDANDSIMSILCDPNDTLEIVHFATVHHRIVNRKEVSLANAMLAKGHKINNKILTVQENAQTIRLDSRFGSNDFVRENWIAVEEQLAQQLEKYNGREILFMIDSLPPTAKELASAPDTSWLFEDTVHTETGGAPVTFVPATDAELFEAWVAEECGAFSEYAA